MTTRRVLLGITGSIAAYKSISLVRRLKEEGVEVEVAMTPAAARFVSPLVLEVMSGHPVASDPFETRSGISSPEILHLTLARRCDLFLVAPATADFIAKAASGSADDLVSALFLAIRRPVLLAPAMDAEMWEHPLTQRNLACLKEIGIRIIPPEVGSLASGSVGPGRLASEETLLAAVREELALPVGDLTGKKILVTAGPTRELIDAVRFISNPSSGRMGYALARAARARGGEVVLVSGPTEIPPPEGIAIVPVTTAEEMSRAVLSRIDKVDLLFMAAAVSDFRPRSAAGGKIKKGEASTFLELEPTTDILKEAARRIKEAGRPTLLVGFAAESEDLIQNSLKKLKEKGLPMIVANEIGKPGSGFSSQTNLAKIIRSDGSILDLPPLSKEDLADRIITEAVSLLSPSG